MNRPFSFFTAAAATALLTIGCGYDHQTTRLLEPTAVGGAGNGGNNNPSSTPSLVGIWTSNAQSSLPSPNTCATFQYEIASQTSTSIAGRFTGTCGNGLTISGDATGQLNGSLVTITVAGTGSMSGIPSCTFTLTGNGAIEDNGNTLRIPYSGTTCLGPVNGTGVFHRPQQEAPAPPLAPEPEPPPPPPDDPTYGCSVIADREKLVECIHDAVNPARTVEGGFEVTKRVAWALRGEGAGLLIKNAGENIISWQGYSFAAGRICYPDGHIFKVLTDVPGTNGPSWQDNGFVDRSLYVPAIDPTR